MSSPKRTVLITGCSEGGIGAALAVAFHEAGLRVIATARDPSKMAFLEGTDIERLSLDIQSEPSIKACVGKLSSLDILVNNAGIGLQSPLSDVSLDQARGVFDLNVLAQIAMTQACLPLLLESRQSIIVNHTSSASIIPVPFQAIYNASKAAFGMISDVLRLELEAFNVKVIELKTGLVRTNFSSNVNQSQKSPFPEGSIYEPARDKMDRILKSEAFAGNGTDPHTWARLVVRDVLKRSPPTRIYQGESARFAWIIPMMPFGFFNGKLKKVVGLDVVEEILKNKLL